MHPDDKESREFQREFQMTNLTARQRQRHRELLASGKGRKMSYVKNRSTTELSLIVVILVAVLTVSVWQVWSLSLSSTGDESDPPDGNPAGVVTTHSQATEGPTITDNSIRINPFEVDTAATAAANNCHLTPIVETPPLGFNDRRWGDWLSSNGIWLGKPAGFVGVVDSDDWYAETVSYPLFYSTHSQEMQISARLLTDPSTVSSFISVPSSRLPGYLAAPEISIPDAMTPAAVEFTEPGCWEIQVTAGDAEASFVIYVLHLAYRQDVIGAARMREIMTAYPAPTTCKVSPWTGPQPRNGSEAYYWLDSDDGTVSIRTNDVFFERNLELGIDQNQHLVRWYISEDEISQAPIQIVVEKTDQTRRFAPELHQKVDYDGRYWESTLIFPEPGCWTITIAHDAPPFTATVYVYPEACLIDEGEITRAFFSDSDIQRDENCVAP